MARPHAGRRPVTANGLALANGQLVFAALLALVFALTTVFYLGAMWCVAARLSGGVFFVVHTLYLGWQSNIAFMAVIAMSTAHHALRTAPEFSGLPWNFAPWVPVGAAVLYLAMIAFSLLFTALLRRGGNRTAPLRQSAG